MILHDFYWLHRDPLETLCLVFLPFVDGVLDAMENIIFSIPTSPCGDYMSSHLVCGEKPNGFVIKACKFPMFHTKVMLFHIMLQHAISYLYASYVFLYVGNRYCSLKGCHQCLVHYSFSLTFWFCEFNRIHEFSTRVLLMFGYLNYFMSEKESSWRKK